MVGRSPQSVQIFKTNKPTRHYVEVGIVTSRPTGGFSSAQTGDVIAGLREKAAEVGCDAVIITGTRSDVYGAANSTTITVSEKQEFQGMCIVYSEEN